MAATRGVVRHRDRTSRGSPAGEARPGNRRRDQITHQLNAPHRDYADARKHLNEALDLLENCATIYSRCDDTNRRLCNQALFAKIYIDEDNTLRPEHAYEGLVDPQLNGNALTWAEKHTRSKPRPVPLPASV
jgi:hypothetical protein